MTSDFAPVDGSSKLHPTTRRFLQMIARPDLRAEFPEQFEKHWENKGLSGTVRILHFRIANHPCDLTFSLFFNGEEVVQTGIVIKYQGEPLLNEVQKGDSLNYMVAKRIDPIAFLKLNYPNAGPGLPAETQSYTLAVDDDSEPEVLRAVQHLTGKSEFELQAIWQELLVTNDQRAGVHRVSPIIKTWLKKERDRIDLQYLRFAEILQPRTGDVMQYSRGAHQCVVVRKGISGQRIREMIDVAEPEWWGGMYFGMNQGQLVRVPHEAKDRYLVLEGLDSKFEFPVEEIFVDNRQIYAVMFVGEEALVWRTLHQAAPDFSQTMPEVASLPQQPAKESGLLSRLKPKAVEPEPESSAMPEPTAPEAHPYLVARAEKEYMAALRGRKPELKAARQEYLRLVYESDPNRYAANPAELSAEICGAAEKALGRDAAAIQREASLLDAYVTIFFEDAQ